MRYHLDYGISFPEARQKAVAELAGARTASLLESPNNILGIEYLKALRRLSSSIQPFTLKRMGPDHDGERPMGGYGLGQLSPFPVPRGEDVGRRLLFAPGGMSGDGGGDGGRALSR